VELQQCNRSVTAILLKNESPRLPNLKPQKNGHLQNAPRLLNVAHQEAQLQGDRWFSNHGRRVSGVYPAPRPQGDRRPHPQAKQPGSGPKASPPNPPFTLSAKSTDASCRKNSTSTPPARPSATPASRSPPPPTPTTPAETSSPSRMSTRHLPQPPPLRKHSGMRTTQPERG
jgi:hypothetical protein